MAQKVNVLFIDDIDGSDAEGTVRFGLDGADYEIDLNAKHAEELRAVLAKYVEAARKTAGLPTRKRARRGSGDLVLVPDVGGETPPYPMDNPTIRQWNKDHGYDITDRGRVSAAAKIRYREAMDKEIAAKANVG